MKSFNSDLQRVSENVFQLELDKIYKSVAVLKYLKSSYKNVDEDSYDDRDFGEYSSLDNCLDNITFMNRELYISNDGVKVIRTYHSDLYSNVLTSINVKLFLNNLVYEKDFYSKQQLVEFLNNSTFIQEKWKLLTSFL